MRDPERLSPNTSQYRGSSPLQICRAQAGSACNRVLQASERRKARRARLRPPQAAFPSSRFPPREICIRTAVLLKCLCCGVSRRAFFPRSARSRDPHPQYRYRKAEVFSLRRWNACGSRSLEALHLPAGAFFLLCSPAPLCCDHRGVLTVRS